MARRREKPYRFRACKGRAISVEFDFMPGRRISTGCYDMASAVLWAEDWLRDNGKAKDEKMTFRELADGFYSRTDSDSFREREKAFGRNREDEWFRKRQSMLNRYIMPEFGPMLVTAISQPMVENWVLGLKSRDSRKPLANDTRNKILIALRFILDDAKRKGIRSDNPARDAAKVSTHGNTREALPQHQLTVLFPEDQEERIKVWGSLMWAVYFSIFYDTGMRPGEIAALRVCDIYSTPNGLAVGTRRSVSKNRGAIKEGIKTTGKGYSRRGGLLYEDTAALLVRYIREEKLSGDAPLFHAPRRKDGLLMPETSNKRFKTVMERFGFYHEGIVQYCLRHSYETDRKGDLPDEELAVSMGHTVLRRDYDHQDEVDIVRRLESHRDSLFRNRLRLGQESDIIPLEEALAKKKAPQGG